MKTNLLYRYFLCIVILLPFLLAFTTTPVKQMVASSTPAVDSAPAGLDVYLVDITLLNISDINISAGTFQVDMYVKFVCKDPPCQYEPHWDVMNAVQDIAPVEQGTSVPFQSYNYRLKTSMIGSVDYTYYPFTYICFHVFIEDKMYNNQELTYKLNSLRPDKVLFNPAG